MVWRGFWKWDFHSDYKEFIQHLYWKSLSVCCWNLNFKNCFNFKDISSYKNWFKQRFQKFDWAHDHKADPWSAQQTNTSQNPNYTMHTDRALLPSHGDHLCSALCFYVLVEDTELSVVRPHTVQISVEHLPASWRSGPWEYGNTPVRTASHKSKSPGGVTQRPRGYSTPEWNNPEDAHRESRTAEGSYVKIYPQHHNKQYVERSKCFTLTKDEQTAKTNTQCQDIRAHTQHQTHNTTVITHSSHSH